VKSHNPLKQLPLLITLAALVLLSNFTFSLYIIYPVHLFFNWLHEMFHALAGMMVGGEIRNFEISTNTLAYAAIAHYPSPFRQLIVAGFPYFGIAGFGAMLFLFTRPTLFSRMIGFTATSVLLLCIIFQASTHTYQFILFAWAAAIAIMAKWPISKRQHIFRFGLIAIGCMLIISLLLFRQTFALITLSILAVAFIAAGIALPFKSRRFTYQLIAAVCCCTPLLHVTKLFSEQHHGHPPNTIADAYAIHQVLIIIPPSIWALILCILGPATLFNLHKHFERTAKLFPDIQPIEAPVKTPTPEPPQVEAPVKTPTPEPPQVEAPVEMPTPEPPQVEAPRLAQPSASHVNFAAHCHTCNTPVPLTKTKTLTGSHTLHVTDPVYAHHNQAQHAYTVGPFVQPSTLAVPQPYHGYAQQHYPEQYPYEKQNNQYPHAQHIHNAPPYEQTYRPYSSQHYPPYPSPQDQVQGVPQNYNEQWQPESFSEADQGAAYSEQLLPVEQSSQNLYESEQAKFSAEAAISEEDFVLGLNYDYQQDNFQNEMHDTIKISGFSSSEDYGQITHSIEAVDNHSPDTEPNPRFDEHEQDISKIK
jgi:hypothetical protein